MKKADVKQIAEILDEIDQKVIEDLQGTMMDNILRTYTARIRGILLRG